MEDCLADAYLEMDWLDEAIAEYQRILRLNPNYPRAHSRLGLAYQLKGDREAARAETRRFLELWKEADPDAPQLLGAKRRLQQLSFQ
jgi:Flp pilus assembly protein TadD